MDLETKRYIDRLFARQARRMRNVISRGVVTRVADGHKLQENQIALLDGEVLEGAERVQQYGFTSHPQVQAECFVAFAGSGRDHPLIFSVDDRRFRLSGNAAGEVVIYTDEGDSIALRRGNTILVTTKHLKVQAEEDISLETKIFSLRAETSITLDSPLTAIRTDNFTLSNRSGGSTSAVMQGSLTASEDLSANGGAVSLRGHIHEGVQSGDSTTGIPVGGS
jgi:phage baseplate assembly protein V